MENKKYKLTKNTKEWCGTTLFQIEALISFGSVSKGELGGYIEAEKNLSVYGDAWVYGDARVYDNARVSGNARVYGKFALTLGYFFGTRYKNEEIKYHKIDDDYEIIYKGDAKIEAYDDKSGTLENTTEQEAIALLKKNGYRITKE